LKGGRILYSHYYPSRNPLQKRSNLIKVTGEGEIAVQPDTATVHLGVITEAKDLIPAQQENSIISTKIIDSLIGLGIDKNLIRTFDYRIETNYDFDQGKQVFRGYKITHILEVKIEDLPLVGKVVDTAVQNGANYVANVQFTTKFKDSYYHQALTLAVTDAGEKAITIANAIKVTLNPTPILVTEGGSFQQPFENKQFAASMSPIQIQPGQLMIKATITAEYIYA
jgi:uncharacterized protein